MKTIKCPKCGFITSDKTKECPKCGLIFEKYKKVNKKETKNQKQKTRKKTSYKNPLNLNSVILAISLLIIISTILYVFYDYKKTKYIKNINDIKKSIIKEEEKSLGICELNILVWQNAIENRVSFNNALSNFHNKILLSGLLESFKTNKKTIEKQIKKMNKNINFNPEAKEKLIDLYGTYSQIYSLAIEPNGSLIMYSNRVHKLKDKFTDTLNRLNVLLPDDYDTVLDE